MMNNMGSKYGAAQIVCCALIFSTMATSQTLAWNANDNARWSATQTDGNGLNRGDATTLLWSIVPDGQSYERSSQGKTSNLVQFLDDGWNVAQAQRTPDFTNRPWWDVINNAYSQYARVSGATLTYVPELDASGASTGMSGDIRLGGEDINGDPGGALADNVFPNGGDMRIDTVRENNGSVGSYFSTEPGLRNLVIHETGHGVGLGHSNPLNGSAKAVMEGGLRTDIWGLQFDDIYGLNRLYGDPNESNGGNDSHLTATDLGNLGSDGRTAFGLDAARTSVDEMDGDWLGIDGRNDNDWFKFSVSDSTTAKIRVLPSGPTYETEEQGVFDASMQSDLSLQIYSSSPSVSLLAESNVGGIGVAETIDDQLLTPGDYFLRVRGRQDVNQFYRIDLLLDDSDPIADFDADGDVDDSDLALWQAGYGTGATLGDGDADRDGDVDGNDFLTWQRQYGLGINPLATSQAIPEPHSLILALAATLMAAPLRRQSGR